MKCCVQSENTSSKLYLATEKSWNSLLTGFRIKIRRPGSLFVELRSFKLGLWQTVITDLENLYSLSVVNTNMHSFFKLYVKQHAMQSCWKWVVAAQGQKYKFLKIEIFLHCIGWIRNIRTTQNVIPCLGCFMPLTAGQSRIHVFQILLLALLVNIFSYRLDFPPVHNWFLGDLRKQQPPQLTVATLTNALEHSLPQHLVFSGVTSLGFSWMFRSLTSTWIFLQIYVAWVFAVTCLATSNQSCLANSTASHRKPAEIVSF